MTAAAFCGVDPAYVCEAGGGSWWPLLVGVAVLAGVGWWRLRR